MPGSDFATGESGEIWMKVAAAVEAVGEFHVLRCWKKPTSSMKDWFGIFGWFV